MSLNNPPRLFIPGPVQVEDEVLAELARPCIGHRAPEMAELAGPVHELLKRFLKTTDPVFVGTLSATGVMEAAVRNTVRERVLCCVNGAFSSRWHRICVANGFSADRVEVEWGQAIKPEMVADALARGSYDAVTLVHNETSTGVMSPLADIAQVLEGHPDTLLLVDAVSSMAVVPLEPQKLGVDVMLAGCQKGIALPPGLTVFSVSEAALARAETIPHRGFYIDFLDTLKSYQKNQTPATPITSHLFGLRKRLEIILADEERWYGRHMERAELTRGWARERFALFPEEGSESVSLSCIQNTRNMDIGKLNGFLRERGVIIANGYGKLKGDTFRIGHMGDNDLARHRQLLAWIDEFLEQ